jgi:Reverse transcriptase (RNA-dependent DNA polymerase)
VVMPFGLSIGPAVFQRYIHSILNGIFNKGVSVYLDDRLMATETREDNIHLTQEVIRLSKEAGLFAKPEKCEFFKTQVE